MGNMGTEDYISPTHKVGIKLFTEPQLENVFPEYRNLLNRIENHREIIGNIKFSSKRHYQYNLMYDNVFSILGKRGTGKTSVAFTMQKMLEEDTTHPYDIVLPIIIPEMVPKDCSALGWMLAIVKERIEEFEACEAQTCRGSRDGELQYWDNCKYSNRDGRETLWKKVDKLVETYFAGKYNPSNESSFSIAVGNSARQAQNYYQFAQEIAKLWDDWVEAIRQRYGGYNRNLPGGESKDSLCPLIYFIFDDVDLEPDKVGELLSIIIKYLSHPNVIVITTADEEMFLEVIENNLDKDIGRIPKEWRVYLKKEIHGSLTYKELINDNQDLISQTARLYLGKVMPTSTRYYLKLFSDAKSKSNFYVGEKKFLGPSLCGLIGKLLQCRLDQPRCFQDQPPANFLYYGEEPIYFYFHFFGDTSRQIANAYIGLQEFLDSLIKDIGLYNRGEILQEKYVECVYYKCRYALHLLITANHSLSLKIENLDLFMDEIFRTQYNGWKLYVDYAFLVDFLNHQAGKEDDTGKGGFIKMALELYSLCLFMENILLVLEDCTPEGITGRKRAYGTDGLADFISGVFFRGRPVFRKSMEAGTFLKHYEVVLSQWNYMQAIEQTDAALNLKYFRDLTNVSYRNGEMSLLRVRDFYNEDRAWLAEVGARLSLVYGNLYLLGKNEVKNCRMDWFQQNLYGYQQMIYYRLRDGLRDSLDVFNLKSRAEKEIKGVNRELEEFDYDEDSFAGFVERLAQDLSDRVKGEIRNRHQEDKGDCELEIAWDEEMQEEYLNQSFIPASSMIQEIEERCRQHSLTDLLNICPQGLVQEIRRVMGSRIVNSDSILQALKALFGQIKLWENNQKHLYIKDAQEFLNNLYGIGERTEPGSEMGRIITRLVGNLSLLSPEDGVDLIILDSVLYLELKEALEHAAGTLKARWTAADSDSDMDSRDWKGQDIQLYLVSRNFDSAVNLESREEIEQGVELGLAVQLAKGLQRLYLYKIVLEKYGMGYNLSSAGLEKTANGRDTYYYRLFKNIDLIVRGEEGKISSQLQDKEAGTEWEGIGQKAGGLLYDIPFIRNFMGRNASASRRTYIEKIMKEVENESVSY